MSEPTSGWTKCPKARQVGVYWRRNRQTIQYGYLEPGRSQVKYAGTTLQQAKDARAKALLRHSAGLQPPDTKLRIRDLAEEVREAKRDRVRPNSFSTLERALDKRIIPAIGHLKPVAVTPDRIARLIREWEKDGLDGDSIVRYLSPLSQMLDLAVRRGCIATNPMALLTPQERPRRTRKRQYEWTPEDLRALLEAAWTLDQKKALDESFGYSQRQRYYPLIALLAYSGMRVSEALGLRWCDVDFLENVIHVRGSLDRSSRTLSLTKTDAGEREIPMTDQIVAVLLRHKPEELENEESWVFPSLQGDKPLSYHNFRDRGWADALKKANLDDQGITIHSLRHCFASVLIDCGLSDVAVADVIGHASPNTTRAMYAHVFDRQNARERIRAAMEGLGGVSS